MLTYYRLLIITYLEEIFMQRYKKSITFYGRYVDDSIIIIAKNKLNMLLTWLNKYHSRLKFTYEVENNNKINFLNLEILKNHDGTIGFDLYKKGTCSGRYVNYKSSHAIQTKIGIVKGLADKVFNLSDEKFHKKNLQKIKEDLILNGYPENFIKKHVKNQKKKYIQSINKNSQRCESSNNIDYKKIIILPHIEFYTKEIQKYLYKKCNLSTIYYAPFKLDKIIKANKDKLKNKNNKDVVYKISCKKCEKTYVGMTSRLLKTRCEEHKNNIKYKEKYHNVITKHILKNNKEHDMEWEKVEILHREKHWKKRKVAEMVFIKKEEKNSLNKMTDLDELPVIYNTIINKMKKFKY